jgi:hypothetical protein
LSQNLILKSRDRRYDYLKIFAEKFVEKIGVFDSKQSKIMQNFDHNIFEKNANFFAENCRKAQKIMIITSTPG